MIGPSVRVQVGSTLDSTHHNCLVLSVTGINEKITFNKIYKSLLDVFKDLMTPYLTIVSIGLRDTLTAYSSGQLVDTELWKSCMETLTTSFIVDDNCTFYKSYLTHSAVAYFLIQHTGAMIAFVKSLSQSFPNSLFASLYESLLERPYSHLVSSHLSIALMKTRFFVPSTVKCLRIRVQRMLACDCALLLVLPNYGSNMRVNLPVSRLWI